MGCYLKSCSMHLSRLLLEHQQRYGRIGSGGDWWSIQCTCLMMIIKQHTQLAKEPAKLATVSAAPVGTAQDWTGDLLVLGIFEEGLEATGRSCSRVRVCAILISRKHHVQSSSTLHACTQSPHIHPPSLSQMMQSPSKAQPWKLWMLPWVVWCVTS